MKFFFFFCVHDFVHYFSVCCEGLPFLNSTFSLKMPSIINRLCIHGLSGRNISVAESVCSQFFYPRDPLQTEMFFGQKQAVLNSCQPTNIMVRAKPPPRRPPLNKGGSNVWLFLSDNQYRVKVLRSYSVSIILDTVEVRHSKSAL